MKLRLPITRHEAARTRHGLIGRMRMRWGELRALRHTSGAIIVEPTFSWLEARNDGVSCLVKMRGRVLIR